MHATRIADASATVAVDLAKDVFQLAGVEAQERRVAQRRLSHAAFERAFDNVPPRHIVLEACGSAHHSPPNLQRRGHTVTLLPAFAVRP